MAGTNFFAVKTSTLDIALTDKNGYAVLAKCTSTPPTTASIFSHGCIMIQSDTSTGSKALYENVGSTATPSWNAIGAVVAGELTLADTKLFVGGAAGTAAEKAMSGDATLANTGALTIATDAVTTAKILNANVTAAKLATDSIETAKILNANVTTAKLADAGVTRVKISIPAGSKSVVKEGVTIATAAGATNEYIIAPEAGSLSSIEINPLVALATSDTNYITWSVVNLGQAGAGTTAMLAVDDANTTKATGGTALAVDTKRTLTVHGTAANLVVAQGDKVKIVATVSGTLANTVTVPVYILRFGGTT